MQTTTCFLILQELLPAIDGTLSLLAGEILVVKDGAIGCILGDHRHFETAETLGYSNASDGAGTEAAAVSR